MSPPFGFVSSERCLGLRLRVLLLAVLMIGLQTLASIHGVAHRGALAGMPSGQVTAGMAAVSPLSGEPYTGDDWLHRLFADHSQGSADCHLYDQLLHADAAPAAAAVAVVPLVWAPPQEPRTSLALAAQAAGYLARGPPSIG